MARPVSISDDQLLSRAMDLFWLQGADDVSTRDLEAAIGLRSPAIYRRFPSKDLLLARSIDHYVDKVVARRVAKYLDASEDPLAGLHTFFSTTLRPNGREDRLRGCLLANTATDAQGQVDEVRAAIRRGWQLMETAFERQVERAQAAGQIRADLDPEVVGLSLLTTLQGLLTLIRAGRDDLQACIDTTFCLLSDGPCPGSAPTTT